MPDAAADWRLDGIDPTGAFARSVGLARQNAPQHASVQDHGQRAEHNRPEAPLEVPAGQHH